MIRERFSCGKLRGVEDLSPEHISSTLRSLGKHLNCEECKKDLEGRIKQVVVEWTMMKVILHLHFAEMSLPSRSEQSEMYL